MLTIWNRGDSVLDKLWLLLCGNCSVHNRDVHIGAELQAQRPEPVTGGLKKEIGARL